MPKGPSRNLQVKTEKAFKCCYLLEVRKYETNTNRGTKLVPSRKNFRKVAFYCIPAKSIRSSNRLHRRDQTGIRSPNTSAKFPTYNRICKNLRLEPKTSLHHTPAFCQRRTKSAAFCLASSLEFLLFAALPSLNQMICRQLVNINGQKTDFFVVLNDKI